LLHASTKKNIKGFTMFKAFKSKLFGAFAFLASATVSALAAPVSVDLSDAETSITNAGTAMIGIAVVILGLVLVIKFLRKG